MSFWCRIGMHRWGVRWAPGEERWLLAECLQCGTPDEILQATMDEHQGWNTPSPEP